jgi:hypothetical protein
MGAEDAKSSQGHILLSSREAMCWVCIFQSILASSVDNWLCYKLQEPFGEYADIVLLTIAYFFLLDNNRSIDNKVTNPTLVCSDLLHYLLFYYLLRVDINMDRWATIQVCKNCAKHDRFAYNSMLQYFIQLYGVIDFHHDETSSHILWLQLSHHLFFPVWNLS